MLYVDGLPSSHVDMADPARLHMDYLARLATAIDCFSPRGAAADFLHLGGGAVALPRFVAATRPRAVQEVWEIEPELVALARARLGGRKLNLRCGDAAERLERRADDSADVVVGDAFVGTEIPAALASPTFVAGVRRVVRDDGLYLLNVVDEPPWARATAQRRLLRDAFGRVLTFGAREVVRGKRAGNVLLAASNGPLSRERLNRSLAGGPFPGLCE
ncbi:MAG: fused MFS/spermidine synthase [Solirubrobacteraceae bacterium]